MIIMIHLLNSAHSQELAEFSVKPVPGAGISTVQVPLDAINWNTGDGRLALFVRGPGGLQEVACQLETGVSPRLWFLYDNREGEKEYVITIEKDVREQPDGISLKREEESITVKKGGVPVLRYNHGEVHPPEGIDPAFRRSAFIHPLWSPGGEILTRIQPPDHFHHYGIWNPWTSTNIDGQEVDFWNLGKGEARVKFAGYIDAVHGPVYSGFKVRHQHIYYPEMGKEETAINELWDIRVWDTDINGVTIVDLSTTLNSPLPGGILLNAYRYGGGLGFRATEKWHRYNSTVLTSERNTREDADGTKARWCIIGGETDIPEEWSGIIFLSHPANRMHPEPIRMWPEDANGGRGDMFFNFCPIRHNEWKLLHGKSYTLRYRMVIFDGQADPAEAEEYWKGFSVSPAINMF